MSAEQISQTLPWANNERVISAGTFLFPSVCLSRWEFVFDGQMSLAVLLSVDSFGVTVLICDRVSGFNESFFSHFFLRCILLLWFLWLYVFVFQVSCFSFQVPGNEQTTSMVRRNFVQLVLRWCLLNPRAMNNVQFITETFGFVVAFLNITHICRTRKIANNQSYQIYLNICSRNDWSTVTRQ